jgi:hypothetical protein
VGFRKGQLVIGTTIARLWLNRNRNWRPNPFRVIDWCLVLEVLSGLFPGLTKTSVLNCGFG